MGVLVSLNVQVDAYWDDLNLEHSDTCCIRGVASSKDLADLAEGFALELFLDRVFDEVSVIKTLERFPDLDPDNELWELLRCPTPDRVRVIHLGEWQHEDVDPRDYLE
mgnify:CR=1 FL=1|tara:strand:- start:1608 stop:1931 length:324 start_codon:yes stop_codon:yes gene_type:complete